MIVPSHAPMPMLMALSCSVNAGTKRPARARYAARAAGTALVFRGRRECGNLHEVEVVE
jgi:hypothetical protein